MNDADRVFAEAIDDLLDTDIPLSPSIKHVIKSDRLNARNPKRRKHNKDAALAYVIAHFVRFVEGVLRDAGYKKEAKGRAEKYAAKHWRDVMQKGFSSDRAVKMWLWHRRGITKSTPNL